MEWPPATGMPADAQTDAPPFRISRTISVGILSTGMPRIASAMIGLPPIA